MAHGTFVLNGDAEGIAHRAAQGGAGRLSVEQPARLAHARGDLDFLLRHGPRFLVDCAFRRLQHWVKGLEILTRRHALSQGRHVRGSGNGMMMARC